MPATKTVVFAALVVALAVNIELFKDPVNPGMPISSQDAEHDEVYPCSLDPGWQCKNTFDWHNCQFNEQCIVSGDIAI